MKIQPLWGRHMVNLIKKITSRNLPAIVLMGTPEATIISVIDGFFCYKANMPYLCEEDIFWRILKARAYDPETERKILEAKPENLITFIKLILEIDNPGEKLSSESINNLISEYRRIRKVPSDE